MTPWLLSIIVVALGALFYILPKRTRPDLYFAVTVDPEFPKTPEGRRILQRYRTLVLTFTGLALAWIGYFLATGATLRPPVVVLITLSLIPLLNGAMVLARHRTMRHRAVASPIRESSLSRPALRIPGGAALAAGPFVFLALLGVYAWVQWDALPARFPIHFGLDGPDRWLPRTPANIAGFLLMLAAMCASYVALQFGIVHSMRRIFATGKPAIAEERFKRLSLVLLQVAAYFIVLPAGIALLVPAEDHVLYRMLPWMVGGFVAFTLLCLAVMIRWGQGGGRVGDGDSHSQSPTGDGTPDECWKLGLFYFNPADEAVLVEARFGIGQTLNWAKAQSWLIVAILLMPLFVLRILNP